MVETKGKQKSATFVQRQPEQIRQTLNNASILFRNHSDALLLLLFPLVNNKQQ